MNVEISKKQLLAILNESAHMGDVDEMSWVNPAPHLGIPVKKGKSPEPKAASFTNNPKAPTGEVEGAHWRAYNALGQKKIAVGPMEGADFKTNQEFFDYLKAKNPGFLKDLKDFENKGYEIYFNINWVSQKFDPIEVTKSKPSKSSLQRRADIGFTTDTADEKIKPLSDYIHRSILGDANKFLTYNAKGELAQEVTNKLQSSLLPVLTSNNLDRSKGQEKAQKQTTRTRSVTNENIIWTSWNDTAWDSFDRFHEAVTKAKGGGEFTKGQTVNLTRQDVDKQAQKEKIVDGKVSTGNKFTITGTKQGDSFVWNIKIEFYLGIGQDLTQDEDWDYLNIPKGTVSIVEPIEATATSEDVSLGKDGAITSNPNVAFALKTAMKEAAEKIINSNLLDKLDEKLKNFTEPQMPADYEDWKKKNAAKLAGKPTKGKKKGNDKQAVGDENLAEQKINSMVLNILREIKK